MIPPSTAPMATAELPLIADIVSAFYLHLEVADEPGVLATVANVLAVHDVSVKSVVQRGSRAQATLVMVTHPVLESRFMDAMREIAELPVLRSPPRSIRVIEEEFSVPA